MISYVNGTGVDEEDRKKALVIIFKRHSPFLHTTKQPTSFIQEKNLTSRTTKIYSHGQCQS